MKKIIYAIAALAFIVSATSCDLRINKDQSSPEGIHTPAVNTAKITPMPDESGATKVYQGTNITVGGFNLDNVGKVTLGGEVAEIVEKNIRQLIFAVPSFPELPQSDNPHLKELKIFDKDGETSIYTNNFFVTVPVTDALVSEYAPQSGTVGTVVTIKGRNIDQVTKIFFNTVAVEESSFVSHSAAEIAVAVPAVPVSGADNNVAIKAIWGGTREIDVTGTTPFVLEVPSFNAYTATDPAKIGDEIEFTGTHLDYVSKAFWGTYELLITQKSATAITVKFPSAIEKTDPVVCTKDLTVEYGSPAQTTVGVSSFALDTTPMGPAKPSFTSAVVADTGYTLFHLGRTVTVSGSNMATIDGFTVDGIAATLVGTPTDIAAQFIIPGTITGTAARDVELKATYNGGEEAFTETIKVYPFFYTKGLKIRTGSNSKSTYPADNREAAFLDLNAGKVVSVDYWNDTPMDAPAKTSGSNPMISAAGKLSASATAESYYAVKPYYFITSSSANKLAFQNPANSASQLKTHFIGGTTALPGNYGTPSIYARIITDDAEFKAAAVAGTVENIIGYTNLAGSAAPAFGTSEGSTWVKGSVLGLQYVNFEHASTTGGKPTAFNNVRQQGFIVIKDVTCGDAATGLAKADRVGYVEFDLYWSNIIVHE